jgi:hypothetical protein
VVMSGRSLRSPHGLPAVALLSACLLVFLAAAPVSAHFLLNLNVRIFHVEHVSDGLKIYLRTPMTERFLDDVVVIGNKSFLSRASEMLQTMDSS